MNKNEVVDQCPAFEKGCPYKAENMNDLVSDEAKDCPAFEDGCPFKDAQSQEEFKQKMQSIPEKHFEREDFKLAMSHIHELNKTYTELMGKCPEFETGCPFKTICEDSSPLLSHLEKCAKHTVSPCLEEAVKLSKELKLGTKQAHTRAESTHFVTEFVKGRVSEEFYALYVAQLYFIYVALEKRSEECKSHKHFSQLYFPELYRTESLERDLQYYMGFDWRKEVEPLESVKQYVDSILNSSPDELIGHAYTRWLGDLSGGQILKKKAQRHYGLPKDGSGAQFYDFEQVKNHHEFKQKYRRILDGLQLDKKLSSHIVKVANESFNYNTDMFLELDAKLGLAPKPIIPNESSGAECPFGFKATEKGDLPKQPGLNQMASPFLLCAAFVVLVSYMFWRFA